MTINWRLVGRTILRILGEILGFIGRLLRDAWLDLWKRSRPTVIRYLQIGAVVLILFWIMTTQPELLKLLMGIVILIFGFRIILRGAFPKKKKRKR